MNQGYLTSQTPYRYYPGLRCHVLCRFLINCYHSVLMNLVYLLIVKTVSLIVSMFVNETSEDDAK